MNSEEKKKFVKRKVIRTILFAAMAFSIAYLSLHENSLYTVGDLNFASMSTWVQYKFWVRDKASYPLAVRLVQSQFRRVEKMCNIYNKDSELSRLNATAADKPFHCSDDLWNILVTAKKIYELSDGYFDVTILPLKQLWQKCGKKDCLPTDDELHEALSLTGLDKIVFDDTAQTVFFTRKGMGIDLGGIAKGAALDFTADAAASACYVGDHNADEVGCFKRFDAWARGKMTRLDCGYINVGGNICVLPTPEPKTDYYRFAVKNPLAISERPVCAYAKIKGECVSTSGSYERFSTINGKRYSHIINPKTGMPVERSVSATVVTKRGIDSDAISTAIFVGGKEIAIKMKATHPDLRVLLYEYADNNKEDGAINTFTIGEWDNLLPVR